MACKGTKMAIPLGSLISIALSLTEESAVSICKNEDFESCSIRRLHWWKVGVEQSMDLQN
jgi:hypothetical protein